MRQIILDTETTGLETKDGHKIIEIGCVEMIDRRLTGNHFHQYLNPDRHIDAEAVQVHGITMDFLADKPRFYQIVDQLMEYLKGAELVIHNANFDIGFLNYELSLLRRNDWSVITDHCTVLDTLALARAKHPGQRLSLDALCKRYGINNTHRKLHGALLDAEILAEVYLAMTGGQESLLFHADEEHSLEEADIAAAQVIRQALNLPVIKADTSEIQAHTEYLNLLDKVSNDKSLWGKLN
ncbi:MAG: polymerase subunit epsilon [Gammaproteobacteria bacterium]|jgi:DNA polymerase-3 subunit epsilon|nr:polymerase subunit epsilon [Gammaproteobacteria bacterium]